MFYLGMLGMWENMTFVCKASCPVMALKYIAQQTVFPLIGLKSVSMTISIFALYHLPSH